QQIADLSFFLRTLAPPVPATSSTAPGLLTAGRALFEQTGCAVCHVPSLRARDGSMVPLYSDLLLHDVQSDSYIGVADGSAEARELRTPLLWGLHETAPYLHDGKADTVEQAIAAHASEASAARQHYEQLGVSERATLLTFLQSL
ncbi:MAG: hypothetical protein JWN48_5425, partial [Myxococcaceae bacterium]|nr:hypothetical protein [Myxococcaceae bacterium]